MAAWQHALTFLLREPQRFEDLVLQTGDADLLVSLPKHLQSWQHELLKARHAHLLYCSCLHDYIRNTPNRVGSAGALSVAEKASERTRLVSCGAITPSSHRRAVA